MTTMVIFFILLSVLVAQFTGFIGNSALLQSSPARKGSRNGWAVVDCRTPFQGRASSYISMMSCREEQEWNGSDDNKGLDSRDSRQKQAGSSLSRREMFSDVLYRSSILGAAAVTCSCCMPNAAYGLAQITSPPPENMKLYDLPRNTLQDAAFAQGMSVGMVDYEREAYPTKKRLFRTLFDSLEKVPEPVLVEVGMGSFPNALYYKQRLQGKGGLDIIGVDPNDRMSGYAKDNAEKVGLLNVATNNNNSLRIVHGVSEALPLDDASCDAVVCTLTLCSVVDPVKSVSEIRRVLKPGGKFLFWEHVLSETDPAMANYQKLLTPGQVKMADGCHLDRRTGDVIRAAGFKSLDLEYMELKNFSFLNPTVCGIATA